MIEATVINPHPSHFTVNIPVPSSKLGWVKDILVVYGIPKCRPSGGPGWILGDGEISITGQKADVERVTRAILARLNLKMFSTGAEVLERHRQGALP